jgi:HEAT repeat protein
MRQILFNRLAGSKSALGAPRGKLSWKIPGPGLVPAIVLSVALSVACSSFGQSTAPKNEKELIAVLRSDASDAEKGLACKNLSVYGSDECVPEVAKLLSNEKLSSWARITLEAIPGSAADDALRKAAESMQGRQLVGVLNSIGVRRDAKAVGHLVRRLADQDIEVASAAAVALGRIGNMDASKGLMAALAAGQGGVKPTVAEGLVLGAERSLAGGNAAEAIKIYDEVRKADVPRQRMLEATRGAILARGDEGIPLLVEQLRSNDKNLFQIALGTAREFPGKEIDKALAGAIDGAFPERAALIITAMADRPKTVDLATIKKAAGGGAKPVRLAAIAALGRVGDATCLATLLDVAIESDAELVKKAKEALADLPGAAVDKEIASRLSQAQGKTYPVLIELVGQRRIEAIGALTKALDNSDRAVRTAALTALGNTVPDKYLSVLINQVVTPKDSETAPVAQVALKTAAVRMPDRDACAAELAAALNRAPQETKRVLLDILLDVGGAKALQAVATAAKSNDPVLQDKGSDVLGKWMTLDAGPVLLDLAKSNGRYQGRAFRGYLRIARQFAASQQQRVEMCQTALDATRQPAEQKLVLDVLKAYPSVDGLKLVVKVAQNPELKPDATAAAQAISEKLPKTPEVRELLSKVGEKK